MKILKITLLVIAGLSLIASTYNAIHEQSIYEFLNGIIPAAILIGIYFRISNPDHKLNKSDSYEDQ